MATIIQILQNRLASLDPLLSNETQRIHLKGSLQALVLDYLYNHPSYRGLNFYGGTCLQVLYGLNRLSEDIDLDNRKGIALGPLGDNLVRYFQRDLRYPEVKMSWQESVSRILRVTLRFPVLYDLGLSPHRDETLHLKLEVNHHPQVAVIQHTPVIHLGRSFVPAHFSLETMMAGKMLACLERSFQVGDTAVSIKGRDFYDLLWFMGQGIKPLNEKLARDGRESYTTRTAMLAIREIVDVIRPRDLALDLLPLFEKRIYIEAWIAAFHESFERFLKDYL